MEWILVSSIFTNYFKIICELLIMNHILFPFIHVQLLKLNPTLVLHVNVKIKNIKTLLTILFLRNEWLKVISFTWESKWTFWLSSSWQSRKHCTLKLLMANHYWFPSISMERQYWLEVFQWCKKMKNDNNGIWCCILCFPQETKRDWDSSHNKYKKLSETGIEPVTDGWLW